MSPHCSKSALTEFIACAAFRIFVRCDEQSPRAFQLEQPVSPLVPADILNSGVFGSASLTIDSTFDQNDCSSSPGDGGGLANVADDGAWPRPILRTLHSAET